MIVLSVVWSILAQIIEKKKAAAKKNASLDSSSQPTVQTEWNADPIQIKIESLPKSVNEFENEDMNMERRLGDHVDVFKMRVCRY